MASRPNQALHATRGEAPRAHERQALGANEYMDPLGTFVRWFFIELGVSVLFGAWLLLLLKRRDLWLRYTAAEAALWCRLGLPRRLVDACRRSEESKWFTVIVSIVFAGSLLVAAGHGFGYIYFKEKLK
jgi:hypothetical protein